MFYNYAREINNIAGWKYKTPTEYLEWFMQYENKPCIKWHMITYNEDAVGFFIVGTKPECHPDADYFIIQMYIKPEFRRHGLGKKALADFISRHKGVYIFST